MFSVFKRKQRDAVLVQEMVSAVRFRGNLDRLLVAYDLQVDSTPDQRLIAEVTQAVVFITERAIECSGKEYKKLSKKEAVAIGLVTFVAADHLSRLARVDFELTGVAAGHAVWAPLFGATKATEIVTSAALEFNRLSESPRDIEIVIATGKCVAKFFDTNDFAHIENLREPLEVLYARVNS